MANNAVQQWQTMANNAAVLANTQDKSQSISCLWSFDASMHVVQQPALPWWCSLLSAINSPCTSFLRKMMTGGLFGSKAQQSYEPCGSALSVIIWLWDYCNDSNCGFVQLICVIAFNPGAWLTSREEAISLSGPFFSRVLHSLNCLPWGGRTILSDCDFLLTSFCYPSNYP